MIAVLLVGAIVVWRWRSGDDRERVAVRWLGLGLLWTAGFLTFAAAGLGRVVPGLPNDHYHAFADPMVFALVGIGAAAAVRSWRREGPRGETPRPAAPEPVARGLAALLAVAVIALVGWNLLNQPPPVSADGGFPAAEAAAQRIRAVAGSSPVALRSLPSFKPADTYGYPLVRDGTTDRRRGRCRDPGRALRRPVPRGDRGARAAARRRTRRPRRDGPGHSRIGTRRRRDAGSRSTRPADAAGGTGPATPGLPGRAVSPGKGERRRPRRRRSLSPRPGRGGRSGPCPGGCSVAAGLPARVVGGDGPDGPDPDADRTRPVVAHRADRRGRTAELALPGER